MVANISASGVRKVLGNCFTISENGSLTEPPGSCRKASPRLTLIISLPVSGRSTRFFKASGISATIAFKLTTIPSPGGV